MMLRFKLSVVLCTCSLNLNLNPKLLLIRRPPPSPKEKPVASVRPVQSTPVPMTPRQASQRPPRDISSVPGASSGSASPNSELNFPVNYLQKAGVVVQKIVTTTGRSPDIWTFTCAILKYSMDLSVFLWLWYNQWADVMKHWYVRHLIIFIRPNLEGQTWLMFCTWVNMDPSYLSPLYPYISLGCLFRC